MALQIKCPRIYVKDQWLACLVHHIITEEYLEVIQEPICSYGSFLLP
jgi:hypothetical protein